MASTAELIELTKTRVLVEGIGLDLVACLLLLDPHPADLAVPPANVHDTTVFVQLGEMYCCASLTHRMMGRPTTMSRLGSTKCTCVKVKENQDRIFCINLL